MVPEIEEAVNLVHGIKVASEEQVIKIGQINQAIQQLNAIAQHNAESSERLSESSEEMAKLSDELKQGISFFRIEDSNN